MRIYILKRIDTRAPRKPDALAIYLNREAALRTALRRNRRDRGTPFVYRVDGANARG